MHKVSEISVSHHVRGLTNLFFRIFAAVKAILITGASGFIGSFVVEEAVNRGMDVWAGVRASSNRQYLQLPGIHVLNLDYSHGEGLGNQLAACRDSLPGGRWDVVVHCAGVTKCADPADFDRVNHRQTVLLATTLQRMDMMPRQFIFLSTLSIFGPIHDRTFAPICEEDEPHPDTAYGRSKLCAERDLQAIPGLPYVFLRPTGVYGPRERDYYLAMRSIRRHVDFAAGLGRQDLTFVFVHDVVQAVFLAIEKGVTRRAYILSDGQVYSGRAFSDLVRRELGNPWVLRFACPLPLLWIISAVAGWWAGLWGRTCTLNRDKYRIMAQRSWQCDIEPAVRELGYQPAYGLERGVRQAVAWYKSEGWL